MMNPWRAALTLLSLSLTVPGFAAKKADDPSKFEAKAEEPNKEETKPPEAKKDEKKTAKSPKDESKQEAKSGMNADTWSGLAWRSIGPSVTEGRVVDIAVDPTDHNRFFVAAG